MTGGYNENPETPYSAEVILPSGQSCSVPSLPLPRRQHTVSGWTVCGGMEIGTGNVLEPSDESHVEYNIQYIGTGTNCHTFTGAWDLSHHLGDEGRASHVAWQSPAGIRLMGGPAWTPVSQTSVLLSNTTNSTIPGFDLPYSTL